MSRDRGATLVETSIALTIVLLLIFGIMEVGRYIAIWNGVNTAAREGARYGIAEGPANQYTDCAGIRNAAVALSGLAEIAAGMSPSSMTMGQGCL